jgi:hypothetical protein
VDGCSAVAPAFTHDDGGVDDLRLPFPGLDQRWCSSFCVLTGGGDAVPRLSRGHKDVDGGDLPDSACSSDLLERQPRSPLPRLGPSSTRRCRTSGRGMLLVVTLSLSPSSSGDQLPPVDAHAAGSLPFCGPESSLSFAHIGVFAYGDGKHCWR